MQNKFIKIFLFLFLFLLINLFLFKNFVKAEDLIDFQYTPAGYYALGQNHNSGYYNVNLTYNNSTYTASHNNISKIILKSGSDTFHAEGYKNVNITIRKDDDGSFVLATTTFLVNFQHNEEFILAEFDPVIPLIQGDEYDIRISAGSSCTTSCFNTLVYFPPYYSYWIKIYYDNDYVPVEDRSLYISSPKDDGVLSQSNANFSLYYEVPIQDVDNTTVYIWLYNENTLGSQLIVGGDVASTTGHITKNQTLVDSDYQWYAILINDDTTETLATSTTEHFTIDKLGDINVSGSFCTDACGDVATSTLIGEIECALRKAGAWSFCPTENSMLMLNSAYEGIKVAFPFSAFFGLTDAVYDAISTTTLNTTDNLGIPFISTTGTIMILPIISSSTLSNAIGVNNANLFRLTIGWLMWIFIAIIIYLQFKKT